MPDQYEKFRIALDEFIDAGRCKTQIQFAALLGVSPNLIYMVLNKKRDVSQAMLTKLKLAGMNPHWWENPEKYSFWNEDAERIADLLASNTELLELFKLLSEMDNKRLHMILNIARDLEKL